MIAKPFTEYADRNGAPILEVLRHEFFAAHKVLEIGSGTGQHAVRFAAALPELVWQTSDLTDKHAGIAAWLTAAKLKNVLRPLALNVFHDSLAANAYDGVYSANTAHIIGVDGVKRMFELIGHTLIDGGVFCLYGPFRHAGKFNTQSNAAFHESLRLRDVTMGIRDLEQLQEFGLDNDLVLKRVFAMPANNHLVVWHKEST